MRHISQMISEDSRRPIERLRRAQLWKIADALGLSYPVGAPKTTMISLLEANDVDVTQPIAGIQWQVVQGTGTNGQPHQELYPVVPLHASARKGVNADMVLSQKLAEKAKEEDKFEQKRIEVLEKENARLRALEEENARLKHEIDTRLAALEARKSQDDSQPVANKRDYWGTYKKAQAMGLQVNRKMKLNDIEALIAGAEQ